MQFLKIHKNFQLPVRSSASAGGLDIIMPEGGTVTETSVLVPLGFAAAVPENHVALILPRSGVGSKKGVELNNTCGVIDSDYRGQWFAAMRVKNGNAPFTWEAGERVLQMVIVPVAMVTPELVDHLTDTERGEGGFGSTGK